MIIPVLLLCSSESFRHEFSRLGELQSVIPDHVNVMALTATATKTTRNWIIKSLDMQTSEIVSISPIKDNNIVYCVAEKSTVHVSVTDRLTRQWAAMDRIISYNHSTRF
jgi:superfamily II DNA helicase RecQ